MGSKHDILTEAELISYRINSNIDSEIEFFMSRHPELKPEEINILDWGCGRGRSVLKLREQGFNAFGVDIDLNTISNGFTLFEGRGLSPTRLLKHVCEVGCFEEGFFHIIFSEQVLEHVDDLTDVLGQIARLTAPDGISIHSFPASKNIWEAHLCMPFVHWFPKNFTLKCWIAMMLLFSSGPKISWPEAKEKSFWGQAEVYYRYITEKTYYRDNNLIREEFKKCGLEAKYSISGIKSHMSQFLPDYLSRNGFPRGGVFFVALKKY